MPFDAAALLICGRALGEPRFAHAAARNVPNARARGADGGITSHRGPGWNFQCRFFWNARTALRLARVRLELEAALRRAEPTKPSRRLLRYPDAGFARYADGAMVAHIRGKRPRSNLNHGGPFGGGGLPPCREPVGARGSR